jgi:hypothetical protein
VEVLKKGVPPFRSDINPVISFIFVFNCLSRKNLKKNSILNFQIDKPSNIHYALSQASFSCYSKGMGDGAASSDIAR